MWMEEDSLEGEANGPTFEDLAIDPELSDVDRVVRYSTCAVELQRLVHVLMLSDTAKKAGFEVSQKKLFPLAELISRDSESIVRQNLATQLASLCEFCWSTNTSEAYGTMIRVLLPVFKRLVCDDVQIVRESASVSLIEVANYVREDDLMEHVLSIVLELAHDENNEGLRITAAGLLNGLSPSFGPELCQQFVIPEMISLSQDPSFKVRRAVALCTDKILKVATKCRERLLPAFLRLSGDPIWGVRKACADSLALVAESVDEDTRVEQLLPLSETFAGDSSKWVRGALSQRLGRFIASLPDDKIPDLLIQRFVDMSIIETDASCWINLGKTDNRSSLTKDGKPVELGNRRHSTNAAISNRPSADNPPGSASMDFASNIMYCCAYSFPAVVLKIGPTKWDKLSGAFETLANSKCTVVRRTIAYSLHEMAKILGPEVTEGAFVPVVNRLLRDVDEVKTGIVQTIARIFAAMSAPAREANLRILVNLCKEVALQKNPSNARGDTGEFLSSNQSEANAEVSSPSEVGLFLHSMTCSWRYRHALAKQMPEFCDLFSVASTANVVVPIGIELMHDEVDQVRTASHAMAGPCLKRLGASDENNTYQAFQDTLLKFATSTTYHERQQYVDICLKLFQNPECRSEFTSELLQPLLRLAEDKVPNVRLVLAEALMQIAGEDLDPAQRESLDTVLAKLRQDRDRDVAVAAGCGETEWLECRLAAESASIVDE